MAKLTVSFVRKALQDYDNSEISLSRFVEKLNEESKRELTAKEAGIFHREECVFKYCPTPELCKDKCVNFKG